MSATPESPDGTILAWRDPNGDLFAVFSRIDQHGRGPDDMERWYNADQFDSDNHDGPRSFDDLLDALRSFAGPVVLFDELAS